VATDMGRGPTPLPTLSSPPRCSLGAGAGGVRTGGPAVDVGGCGAPGPLLATQVGLVEDDVA
jgi:hypothetical protein